MATANGRTNWLSKFMKSLIVRLVCYYAVLIGALVLIWRYIPHSEVIARTSLDALFGTGGPVADSGGRRARVPAAPLDPTTLARTCGLAMISAVLLPLPTAWVYTQTRAKRGYHP